MTKLSFLDISSLLECDAEAGKLFWLPRPVEMFADTGCGGAVAASKRWNRLFAGKEAFTATNSRGYRHGCIYGRNYVAHRVIWLLHTGDWPVDPLDHINGDRADNRVANLREVSSSENNRNVSTSGRNKSGVSGVFWDASSKKWRAQVRVDGRCIHLGLFTDIEAAASARSAANARFGFSERHGASA
jgi:hypothetical protein